MQMRLSKFHGASELPEGGGWDGNFTAGFKSNENGSVSRLLHRMVKKCHPEYNKSILIQD